MPKVGSKRFPYTKAGYKAAAQARRDQRRPVSRKKKKKK